MAEERKVPEEMLSKEIQTAETKNTVISKTVYNTPAAPVQSANEPKAEYLKRVRKYKVGITKHKVQLFDCLLLRVQALEALLVKKVAKDI